MAAEIKGKGRAVQPHIAGIWTVYRGLILSLRLNIENAPVIWQGM